MRVVRKTYRYFEFNDMRAYMESSFSININFQREL